MKFNVILFDGFETLDAMGPVEVIGNKLEELYEIGYYSEKGGLVMSQQNMEVMTRPLGEIVPGGGILIPGGLGTRREAQNTLFIERLRQLCISAKYVLTVCTGSGLLAKTGLLKGIRATSSKVAFEWASEQDTDVVWIRKARWVVDGKYYTSSGVSAGMDMAFGFISDTIGPETARKVAYYIEYIWNKDRESDPFWEGKLPQ